MRNKDVKNRKALVRLLAWGLVVLWLGAIFALSAQTAEESSLTSGHTTRFFLSRLYPPFLQMDEAQQQEVVDSLSHVVRKTAHGLVFTLLGVLSAGALLVDVPPKKALLPAWGLGLLAAVMDELHQLLVPGRSCELLDMAIDFSGAAFGAGMLLLLFWARRRRKLGRLRPTDA